MKINWKLRFKNKVTLTALIVCTVGFIYQIMEIMGFVPIVNESEVLQVVDTLVYVLVAVGIIVDPTTESFSDSKRALRYENPKDGSN